MNSTRLECLVGIGLLLAAAVGSESSSRLWADEFEIVAYPGPPLEQVTLHRYQEMADAHFTAVAPGNGAWDGPTTRKALDLSAKVGLRLLATDLRILPWHIKDRAKIPQANIDAVVADYQDHPALLGYFICDEPNKDYFQELATTAQKMHAADSKHPSLINLFPSYGSPKQLGFEDFGDYVRSFVETVHPTVLSYDHYPLRVPGMEETDWYGDLRVVRDESRRAGIPFWICLQSEGIENYLRIPNREEVFWQASTVLAYGARGIVWFTYWTPTPSQEIPVDDKGQEYLAEPHVGGMIDPKGDRTPVYDHVRRANQFLLEAGRALAGWDNAYIAHYNGQALAGEGQSPCVATRGNDFKLVIGTFTNDDRRRVVIANDSYTVPAAFDLSVLDGWQSLEIVASLELEQTKRSDDWYLGPGGCVVLEVKR